MPPFCNDCGRCLYDDIKGKYQFNYDHKCKAADIKKHKKDTPNMNKQKTGTTAGPWEVCKRGDYADDGIVILGDDERIGVIYTEANAALIATAPELLEALKAVRRMKDFEEFGHVAIKVKEAIAKAQGRG